MCIYVCIYICICDVYYQTGKHPFSTLSLRVHGKLLGSKCSLKKVLEIDAAKIVKSSLLYGQNQSSTEVLGSYSWSLKTVDTKRAIARH